MFVDLDEVKETVNAFTGYAFYLAFFALLFVVVAQSH